MLVQLAPLGCEVHRHTVLVWALALAGSMFSPHQ